MFGRHCKEGIESLESSFQYLEKRSEAILERLRELEKRHNLLLDHLNLCEQTQERKVELVPLKSCAEPQP